MRNGNYEFEGYESIEEYIREARLQRSVAIANMIAAGVDLAWRGLKAFAEGTVMMLKAAPNARAVEAQAYLHKAAHH